MRAKTQIWLMASIWAGIVIVGAAHSAFAVEPAVISFMAPTKYTDGSDIAAGTAISYAVYQAERGKVKAKVATITTTSASITTGLTPGVEYCFAVTAIVAGVESAQSGEGCKLVPLLVPQAVVITVR